MKFKVLIYAQSWAPAVGGVEVITKALADGIAKWAKNQAGDSVHVTLVTLSLADGVNDSLLPFRVVRRPSLWKLIQLFLSADIVHLAGPALLPLALGWLLKKRTVLEHHNYQSICPNGLLIYRPDSSICPGHFLAGNYKECVRCNSEILGYANSLRNLFLAFPRRWLSRRVTANVAPSRHMKARASLPQTQVIYHGVADADVSLESLPKRADGPVCFAFVGRLVKEKGISLLLEGASELVAEGCDIHLIIVGDGPERSALEVMAENLGLKKRTEFMGAVPIASISNVLSGATAVVMPSTWEDVAPLVALEQMMQGRVVIASDVGGLGETVNGFGLTFPPGDVVSLKSCMRKTIENRSLSIQMGRRAQLNAKSNFSEDRMVQEHVQLYRRLIESDSRSMKSDAGI